MTKISKANLLNDENARGIIFQALLLCAIGVGLYWLIDNTVTNLDNQGKSLGFDFLSSTAGFQISQTFGTWLLDYEVGQSTYWDVYLIGIANTFLVAILGIIAATVIGFTMGIMRLSNNIIFKSFATTYIEVLRNVPILLQLFFWYFAVLRAMPGKREKFELIPDVAGLNITGLYLPAPVPEQGFGVVFLALLFSVPLVFFLRLWAKRKQEQTGQFIPIFWLSAAILILIPTVAYFVMGSPLSWEFPEFKDTGPMLRRGYQSGLGMLVVPEMLAVWFALSLYTAAFIAEIVRAGILAVSKGQTEAA
ncbi:MAG: amino acid ABC transporter permease, partial [Alphaproteobacteria bacterium]|nr:amino acid ABC transporter permease [Alphaproteobacteria bacterium]